MGPNGPQWRNIEEHELEPMGLEWVRREPSRRMQQQQEEDEDNHVFIGTGIYISCDAMILIKLATFF